MFAKIRYPWLNNIPSNWPMMVMFLEVYKPNIQATVVKWKPPINGFYRCNIDGASKDNPCPSGGAFCIRDSKGKFIFAKSFSFDILTNLEKEFVSFKKGLE